MTRAASKSKRGRTRSQRLETRITAEQKNLIERAAALQGRTLARLHTELCRQALLELGGSAPTNCIHLQEG